MNYSDKLARWTRECLIDAAADVVAELKERLPLGVEFPEERQQQNRKAIAAYLAEKLTEHKEEYFRLYVTTPRFNRERFRRAFAKLLDEICPRGHFRASFTIPGVSPN